MDAVTRFRRLVPVAGALAIVAGSASSLGAQTLPPAQFPAGQVSSTPINIEIYYGVQKVSPVVATEVVTEVRSTVETSRAAESFLDTLRTLREGTDKFTTAAVNLLDKVSERTKPTAEPRHISLISYSTPPAYSPLQDANTPWLASRSNAAGLTAASTPAETVTAPTVVVVREPATEPRPEQARGLFLSIENLLAFGVAAIAFVFGIWARSRTVQAKSAEAIIAPAPVIDPNALQLMGGYNAGPLPDTAERFEIGLTYHEEIQQQKKIEEQNNVAAVEMILNQNLALLASLNPQPLVVDSEGYALPDDTATPGDDFELEVRGAMAATA
jgi:hypothetical protein